MTLFLWVLISLLALTCVGKLVMLATGDMPRRKPSHEALDLLINAGLLVWAAVLLASK